MACLLGSCWCCDKHCRQAIVRQAFDYSAKVCQLFVISYVICMVITLEIYCKSNQWIFVLPDWAEKVYIYVSVMLKLCFHEMVKCPFWGILRQSFLRVDSRFVLSQWETVLHCNNTSHWLGASPESWYARYWPNSECCLFVAEYKMVTYVLYHLFRNCIYWFWQQFSSK